MAVVVMAEVDGVMAEVVIVAVAGVDEEVTAEDMVMADTGLMIGHGGMIHIIMLTFQVIVLKIVIDVTVHKNIKLLSIVERLKQMPKLY
jgi:hypothetical protein